MFFFFLFFFFFFFFFIYTVLLYFFFFFQAEDGIRDVAVTGVQTLLFRSRLISCPSAGSTGSRRPAALQPRRRDHRRAHVRRSGRSRGPGPCHPRRRATPRCG